MGFWVGRSSIYKKITATFVAILLLTGALGTGIYLQGRSVIKDEISQGIQERNSSTADSVYNMCQQIRVMQYQFSGYGDLVDLIIEKQKEKPNRVNTYIMNIQDALSVIWKGNTSIEEAVLISPTAGQVISTGYAWEITDAELQLIEYYTREHESGSLFEYDGKALLMSDYLFGEYYIYAEINLGTFIRGLRGDGKADGQRFLYNREVGTFTGSSASENIMDMFRGGGWQSFVQKPAERDGYLVHAAEINRSEYMCVTYVDNRTIYRSLNIFRNFYVCLLLALFISGLIFINRLFEMVHRPLHVLLEGLDEIKKGNLDTAITVQRRDEFQTIYDSFNDMTVQLKQQIDENYRQEILLQKSELKQLQAQIAPHFLYNSFIVLSNRINAEDYEFAAEFSGQLGQYFMFLTRNGREFLALKEELGHACVYARIQQIRFRNRIQMQLDDLQPEWEDVIVPRLVIQPVFENVFKYAVEKSSDITTMHMGFHYEEDYLDIYIENSGEISETELEGIRGQLPLTSGEIHGMANVYQRLQLIYHGRGGLRLDQSALGGLKVTLRLLKERVGG